MPDEREMTETGRKILTETDPIRLNALAYACGTRAPEDTTEMLVDRATAFDAFLRGPQFDE